MKTILLAAPLLALGLSACQTYDQGGGYGGGQYEQNEYPQPYPPQPYPQPYPSFPQPYPQPYPPTGFPGVEAPYRAMGTEPFWDIEIGNQLVFTDRGNNMVVAEPTPPVNHTVNGRVHYGQRLQVDITMAPCSDNMSNRTFPETVRVTVDARTYRGCGAPSAFYSQIGEDGLPNPGSGTAVLAGSDWRVTRINGQAVPMRDHYLNFMANRVEAKFGCNSLGAGYTVQGEFVTAGALMATRMACPDMRLESAGSNILSQPMRFDLRDPLRLLLSNAAGTIEAIRSN